jgi:hypothetical protein
MSRSQAMFAALLTTVALVGAGCSSDSSTSGEDKSTDTTGKAADAKKPLEVDRTSRFAKADTFCQPAATPDSEKPTATGDGITSDAVSITHIRVKLEDLTDIGFAIPIGDPADQVKKFVGLVNDRCGGIHGRKLDLHLVEAAPLAGEGQDPAAIAQAACIKATEDNKSVFAFSGTGWGGQGGASCVTSQHDTIYLTTYTISPEDLADADNRLYSTALSPADGLKYAAKVLKADGALDGKKIGVVMADSPGDPEIVQAGLLDTLDDMGIKPARVDAIGCNGGNNCTGGVIESVRGMIQAGVDVVFPLLNVISLPGYLQEMATQGVKPGQIQFYNTDYNAQSGDLVSSKVPKFGGDKAGALYNNTEIISAAQTGAFRMPGYTAPEFGEMCNREYQAAGGAKYSATDPDTNSAYGATAGSCAFVRIIARALDGAGVNPTRKDLASAVEHLGALDGGGPIPPSFEPGKYTAPNSLYKLRWHYPCPPDKRPFDGICILPEGDAFRFPQ